MSMADIEFSRVAQSHAQARGRCETVRRVSGSPKQAMMTSTAVDYPMLGRALALG